MTDTGLESDDGWQSEDMVVKIPTPPAGFFVEPNELKPLVAEGLKDDNVRLRITDEHGNLVPGVLCPDNLIVRVLKPKQTGGDSIPQSVPPVMRNTGNVLLPRFGISSIAPHNVAGSSGEGSSSHGGFVVQPTTQPIVPYGIIRPTGPSLLTVPQGRGMPGGSSVHTHSSQPMGMGRGMLGAGSGSSGHGVIQPAGPSLFTQQHGRGMPVVGSQSSQPTGPMLGAGLSGQDFSAQGFSAQLNQAFFIAQLNQSLAMPEPQRRRPNPLPEPLPQRRRPNAWTIPEFQALIEGACTHWYQQDRYQAIMDDLRFGVPLSLRDASKVRSKILAILDDNSGLPDGVSEGHLIILAVLETLHKTNLAPSTEQEWRTAFQHELQRELDRRGLQNLPAAGALEVVGNLLGNLPAAVGLEVGGNPLDNLPAAVGLEVGGNPLDNLPAAGGVEVGNQGNLPGFEIGGQDGLEGVSDLSDGALDFIKDILENKED